MKIALLFFYALSFFAVAAIMFVLLILWFMRQLRKLRGDY